MAHETVLDPGAMERLEDWGGPTLKLKMIELFLTNAPDRMQGIRGGLEGGDLELAERSAHSLKSSAANLGAEAVRSLSARIEEALESGEEDGARALLPDLENRFIETVEALEVARNQGGRAE